MMSIEVKKFQSTLRKWHTIVILPTAAFFYLSYAIFKIDLVSSVPRFAYFLSGVILMGSIANIAAKISLDDQKYPKIDIAITLVFALVVSLSWFY